MVGGAAPGLTLLDGERSVWYDNLKEKIAPKKSILTTGPKRQRRTTDTDTTSEDPDLQVMEFYANAYRTRQDAPDIGHQRTSWVKGRHIAYDRDTISTLLGNPWEPTPEDNTCFWKENRNKIATKDGDLGYFLDQVAHFLSKDGIFFNLSKVGRTLSNLLKTQLTPIAQAWSHLMLHNITLVTHLSSIPVDRCCLLYSILQGHIIDIAELISEQIHLYALGYRVNRLIPFSLITSALLRRQGVVVPSPEFTSSLRRVPNVSVNRDYFVQ
ncbi:hypothetical protein RJT34_17025 [Clitoria ternatea]|uniref:Putative plant transposon protein domain-containing protein n=1 Tax=Clitoria ternatea TaxID=43366 RepID=A0AAN9J8G9_CLITE